MKKIQDLTWSGIKSKGLENPHCTKPKPLYTIESIQTNNQKNMNEVVQKLANRIKPIQIKLEIGLCALLCIGILLRDSGMGEQLTMISLGILAMLYFVMSFRPGSPDNRFLIFINKLIHLSYSIGIMGILFAINHYPNAEQMLFIGFLSILFGLIGLLILKFRKTTDKKDVDPDLIRTFIIASILAGLLVFGNSSDFKSYNPVKNVENHKSIER